MYYLSTGDLEASLDVKETLKSNMSMLVVEIAVRKPLSAAFVPSKCLFSNEITF